MSDYTKYTKQEMQAYAIAKNIKENQIVIVGTGLPLIGASLAKRAVCPSCHPIVESGLMDCDPVEVPRSVGDNRFMAHCAVQWPNIRFVGFEANEWLHDEDRLVAFIGGAQIDPYGNVNSTCFFGKGDYLQPTTRFTGSGGANGIATYCNTIIMMQHQKRRFMAAVRSGPLMFAELARASGLTMRETLDVFAEGVKVGKLCIADDMPGFRHVAEVV